MLKSACYAPQCAIYGNFSAPKAQEIVVSRGCYLELLRPDDNGKVQTILSSNVFGVIRALAPFRLTGGLKDYIIIGSDSGRIVILEYSKEKHAFVKLHQVRTGFIPSTWLNHLQSSPGGWGGRLMHSWSSHMGLVSKVDGDLETDLLLAKGACAKVFEHAARQCMCLASSHVGCCCEKTCGYWKYLYCFT